MIGLLQRMVDQFVCWIQTGATLLFNAIISGVGSFTSFIIGLLPDMPGQPPVPEAVTKAVAFAYWFVDFGWILSYIVLFFGLLLAVFVVMVPLRWLKVVE